MLFQGIFVNFILQTGWNSIKQQFLMEESTLKSIFVAIEPQTKGEQNMNKLNRRATLTIALLLTLSSCGRNGSVGVDTIPNDTISGTTSSDHDHTDHETEFEVF